MVWCTQIFLQWWCGARRFFLQRWCGPHRFFFSSRLFAAIGSTQIFLPIGGVHANYSTRLFRHSTHMVPSCKSMWPSNMLQALVPNGSGAEHIAFYKTHVGSLTKKWIKKSPTTNNIVPPKHLYKTHIICCLQNTRSRLTGAFTNKQPFRICRRTWPTHLCTGNLRGDQYASFDSHWKRERPIRYTIPGHRKL